jgi:hypothetical protein
LKKIKLLFTFDHELPLGKATDYQRAIFEPTNNLLQLADSLDIPVVLFTDICSAVRFREWDYENYFMPYQTQIQSALLRGHDVQLHIHPHWMTSKFGNEFNPSNDFSLSNFKNKMEGNTIESIIELAFNELTKICKTVIPDYRCRAFRAGGYDVEPESKRIITKLNELGINFDSSVIKGYYLDYSYSRVDYSRAPDNSEWYVSLEGPLIKPSKDGLKELPISSKPIGLFHVIERRIKKLLNNKVYKSRVYQNGGQGFLANHSRQRLSGRLHKIFNPIVLSLDKENFEYEDLKSIIDYNVKRYESNPNDLILTAIGHPKSMGSYHLSLMEKLVKGLRNQYGESLSFVTYSQIPK